MSTTKAQTTEGFQQSSQAAVQHNKPFLNDIVKGNWSLKPVTEPAATSLGATIREYMSQGRSFLATQWENLSSDSAGRNEYPQSKVVHTQGFLNDIAKGNWKLNHISSTTENYLPVVGFSFEEAKDYFETKWEDAKEIFGYGHPQGKVQHTREYLNDIAKGNWHLKHVTSTTEKTLPVVGLTGADMIEQLKDYLSGKWIDIKATFGYDPHPQSKVEHKQQYLNDIATGNWKFRNHITKTNESTSPVVGIPLGFKWNSGVRIRKVDRLAFLKQVSEGHNLRHVKAMKDRSTPVIEQGLKIAKNDNHEKLLEQVTQFGGNRNKLVHVATVDRSGPVFENNMKLTKMDQAAPSSVLDSLREVFGTSGRTGAS